jgi:hypothetical protein
MSVRQMLRVLLLVQLVAAALVGYAIARLLHAGFITGLFGGAIALVLVRLAISADNFFTEQAQRDAGCAPHRRRRRAAPVR